MHEGVGIRALPQPIAVFVPTAVYPDTHLGKNMVKEKTSGAPEITQVFTMLMGLVSVFQCFGEGHGVGAFARYADVVEMDGMIKLVLHGYDDDGVIRHLFIDGDVNAEKESDQNEADQDNEKYLGLFSHGLRFP